MGEFIYRYDIEREIEKIEKSLKNLPKVYYEKVCDRLTDFWNKLDELSKWNCEEFYGGTQICKDNRKISKTKLFRGRMYTGSYIVCGYLNQNFLEKDIEDESIDSETISTGDFYIYDLDDCKIYKVIPESIGQYTGFEDRNGEKIFEGDIIQNGREEQYAVYWYDGGFALKHIVYGEIDNRFNGTIHFNSDDCSIDTFEIVGNIYDDYPELLEELNKGA